MAVISGEGAARAAEAALFANGGCAVALRLPGPAVAGKDAEQLGLATPLFADVPVGPGVWRKQGVNTGLLVGRSGVVALMGLRGAASAEALFASAAGVVVSGVLYAVTNCEALMAGGAPCAYRLTTVAPVTF